MKAPQLAVPAPRGDVDHVAEGLARAELVEALASRPATPRGDGDCFLFGHVSELHVRALQETMRQLGLEHMQRFWVANRVVHRPGYVGVEGGLFDDDTLRILRDAHHIREVQLVVVADDFAWSLAAVLDGLRSLLAPQATLLIAGRQGALLESMYLDELDAGQSQLDVSRLASPASSWARFRLRRRHAV